MDIIYHELDDIFYVEPIALFLQSSEASISPIALRLVISKKNHLVSWSDTSRNRTIQYQNGTFLEDSITLEDDEGLKFTFTPLTVSRYNSIKDEVIAPDRPMDSTEAIQDFYANHFMGV